jgi:5-formyltetrahydrofolate cyclo-ligase
MDLPAIKRLLRAEIRGRILSMSPDQRALEERALIERLPTLPGFAEARTVLLYASVFPEEFDTRPMLRAALDLGKRLLCPRVVRDEKRLALFEIGDPGRDLVPGTKGIPEPKGDLAEVSPGAIDWVLVPGLGYDPLCYRIGRGAGHYDRLLAAIRPEVPCWSLCLTSQWVLALPVEPHDQRLDGVADAFHLVSRP